MQQTTFADGTRLVANFDLQAREVGGRVYEGQGITAFEAGGKVTEYQVDSQR